MKVVIKQHHRTPSHTHTRTCCNPGSTPEPKPDLNLFLYFCLHTIRIINSFFVRTIENLMKMIYLKKFFYTEQGMIVWVRVLTLGCTEDTWSKDMSSSQYRTATLCTHHHLSLQNADFPGHITDLHCSGTCMLQEKQLLSRAHTERT